MRRALCLMVYCSSGFLVDPALGDYTKLQKLVIRLMFSIIIMAIYPVAGWTQGEHVYKAA